MNKKNKEHGEFPGVNVQSAMFPSITTTKVTMEDVGGIARTKVATELKAYIEKDNVDHARYAMGNVCILLALLFLRNSGAFIIGLITTCGMILNAYAFYRAARRQGIIDKAKK